MQSAIIFVVLWIGIRNYNPPATFSKDYAKFGHNMTDGFDLLVIEDDNLLADTIIRSWPVPADRLNVIVDYSSSLSIPQSAKLNFYDGIIIDVHLADGNCLVILRSVRAKSDVPVILISGLVSSESRVAALEIGADGYVMKPFAIRELQAMMARLISVRHQNHSKSTRPVFQTGDKLIWDLERRTLSVDENKVVLTDAEVRMLTYLYENVGRTCSKSVLYKNVFYRSFDPDDNTLEVYINRIRS